MSSTMIEAKEFEKSYGSVQAVKPLDLKVNRGESFALLGPNGGGKTTLIRAVVGLHAATGGRILIDGLDTAEAADQLKKRIAYVPQRVRLPELLSVDEVSRIFARLNGVPVERAETAVERFGLGPFRSRQTRELSGGLLQRLGLVIALMKDASLIVLDEPTASLDPPGRELLLEFLLEQKQGGRTILFSSHLLHSAVQLADRVGVLVDGRLASCQPVSEFRAAVTERTAVRLVLDRIVSANGILVAAEDAGATITQCQDRQIWFRAFPERRLEVVRAIEQAGGNIEEFHTEVPDWEALIRDQWAGSMEN